MTTVAVISGGLREPSSTRLLADQLGAAVRAEFTEAGIPLTLSIVELRPLGRKCRRNRRRGFR